MRRILALLPFLGTFAAPLSAQVVRGRVLDAASGEPVAQAEVTAASLGGRGSGRARSAADGTFTLELRAPGTFRLRAERTGYRPTATDSVAVGVRETLQVELRISATAVAMEPLRVTARVAPPHRRSLEMNGVYERERDGFGRRLFREDIERQSNMSLGQVLARVNGTNRVQSGPFEYIVFGRSAHCLPSLYVDGSLMAYGGRTDINSVVTPGQIEAVELYASAASVPLQYRGSNSACGVILIWTRTEP